MVLALTVKKFLLSAYWQAGLLWLNTAKALVCRNTPASIKDMGKSFPGKQIGILS